MNGIDFKNQWVKRRGEKTDRGEEGGGRERERVEERLWEWRKREGERCRERKEKREEKGRGGGTRNKEGKEREVKTGTPMRWGSRATHIPCSCDDVSEQPFFKNRSVFVLWPFYFYDISHFELWPAKRYVHVLAPWVCVTLFGKHLDTLWQQITLIKIRISK